MSLSDAKILSIKPSDNPFKLIDSHGRYLLVNPGLWVQALKEREVRRNVFAFWRVSWRRRGYRRQVFGDGDEARG
ncbi:TPA: hypothetical protein ACIBR2_001295, partial [Salmonella enterica subsp. enterica serovar Mgulani]